ncbi:MAG: DUF4494 domain-containing protein [Cyclobacteriaceae bacterium]
MKTWYSCKVKYSKEQENGMLKQVTEAYLVDALSYTEAESRIYEAMERDIRGEFAVTQITKTNISEIIKEENESAEDWYKCKIVYSTVDGDSDKEVTITNYFLAAADNITDSIEKTKEFLNSMIVPYSIPSVSLTKIMDVFEYGEERIPPNLKPMSEITEQAE